MSWARSRHLGSVLSSHCPPEESNYSWWDVSQQHHSQSGPWPHGGLPRSLEDHWALKVFLLPHATSSSPARCNLPVYKIAGKECPCSSTHSPGPRWFSLLTSIYQPLAQHSIYSRCSEDISTPGIGPAIQIRKVLGAALYAGMSHLSSHLLPAFFFFASAGRLQRLRLGWAHYGGARSLLMSAININSPCYEPPSVLLLWSKFTQ